MTVQRLNNCWSYLLLLLFQVANPCIVDGQQISFTDESLTVQDFVESVRAATIPYHDLEAALTDGYVKFGPEMPNMGEHYVHPAYAVRDKIDFMRPPVLTYLPLNGKRILTGIAYTIPVQPGELPPEISQNNVRWHFHSGDLLEEAYGLHTKQKQEDVSGIVRLAMIHAWIWTENPDGLFEPDNWALMYKAAGLNPPQKPDPDVARYLFLMRGGVNYYTTFVELAVRPAPEALTGINTILRNHALNAEQTFEKLSEQKTKDTTFEVIFSKSWQKMWRDIYEVLPAEDSATLKSYLMHTHD